MFALSDVELVRADDRAYLRVPLPDGTVGHERIEVTAATESAMVEGTLSMINERVELYGMDRVVAELAAVDPAAG